MTLFYASQTPLDSVRRLLPQECAFSLCTVIYVAAIPSLSRSFFPCMMDRPTGTTGVTSILRARKLSDDCQPMVMTMIHDRSALSLHSSVAPITAPKTLSGRLHTSFHYRAIQGFLTRIMVRWIFWASYMSSVLRLSSTNLFLVYWRINLSLSEFA